MRKLHVAVWHRDRPQNPNDKAYTDKQNRMIGLIQPEHVELPETPDTINYPMWEVSA